VGGTLGFVTQPAQITRNVVLGRYAMGPVLGRGATAVVHRAEDLHTGEPVAVKVVPSELGLADRVGVEARAAMRLAHPGIVPLRDFGEDHECLYLVWELVEGPSLAELMRAADRPSDRGMVRMAGEVLDALAHAHSRGVVHRDVKPGNILIGADGRAHLTDFGVARLSGESGLTLTGSLVGTVAYMAPEQALGDQVGPAADVYSACLVLYECLTGVNPIAAPSPGETARRAAAGAVPPLSHARPDLPGALVRAVDAGLRRTADARPAAAALADELAVLRGGMAAARRRGRRALAPAAAAVAGAGLAALAMVRGVPAEWSGPALTAAAIAAGALLAAWRPRAAAVVAVAAGALLVGMSAPGVALVLGALAAVALMIGWPTGRMLLLPVAAPALFAIGLGPLYAVVAGLAPRWPARLWAITAGMVATVAWQVAAGADGLLAAGGYVSPATGDLADERSPIAAAQRLWEPLGAHPEALLQIPVFVAAAMCVPLVVRAEPGVPRTVLAGVWIAGLCAGLGVAAGDIVVALGATIPTAIVVLVWAVWPWRGRLRHAPARASATLRGSA